METDEDLVHRVRRGDLDAFDALARRHREAVRRVAARIVGPHEADDVAQDALLRALHALDAFRGDAAFKTWILRIATNTALNALARKRPVPVAEMPEPLEADGPAPVKQPADELVASERRERLLTKIGLLGPAHRTVIVLRELEGLSYAEIAEITDSPVGTVKVRLHRARGELADLLRRNTYDWEVPS